MRNAKLFLIVASALTILGSYGCTIQQRSQVAPQNDAEYSFYDHPFNASPDYRESNSEIQVALDMALDKLVHQLRRYKEKLQDHRRTPSAGDVVGPTAQPPTGRS